MQSVVVGWGVFLKNKPNPHSVGAGGGWREDEIMVSVNSRAEAHFRPLGAGVARRGFRWEERKKNPDRAGASWCGGGADDGWCGGGAGGPVLLQ